MGNLQNSVKQFRMQVLDGNDEALSRLTKAYAETYNQLKPQLESIAAAIEEAKKTEQFISPSWLFRQQRYKQLMDQCQTEMLRLSKLSASSTVEQKRKAIELAEEHAKQLTLSNLSDPPPEIAGYNVSWNKIPTSAVTDLVGALSEDSPLNRLMLRYGNEISTGISNQLITGIAQGHNPKKIAANCRKAYGQGLTNILTVCRTETLRAYRSSTLKSYQENDDVVEGWVWHSALQTRTCSACWSNHGKVFPLTEELEDHPNGRCARLPKTKTWQELFPNVDLSHVPDTNPTILSGAEEFAKLPPHKQRIILGHTKFAAYADGKLNIEDIAGIQESDIWGNSVRVKNLKEIGLGDYKAPAIPRTPRQPKPSSDPVRTNLKFDDVKTVQELEQWAKENHSQVEWDLSGTHMDTIKPTMQQYNKLAEEFPEVAARLKYIGTYGGRSSRFDGELAHASRDGKRIGLNPYWYGNPGRYQDGLDYGTKTGFHPPGCNNVESVMTHEFGHHVWNYLASQDKKAVLKYVGADGAGIVSDTAELWQKRHQLTTFLSKYAETNEHEKWAEAFASGYHTEKPIKIVKDQRKLIKALHPSNYVTDFDFATYAPAEIKQDALETITKFRKKLGIQQ